MREKSGAATTVVTAVDLARRNHAWTLLWYANMARMAMSRPSFLLEANTYSRFWMSVGGCFMTVQFNIGQALSAGVKDN